MFKLDPFQEEAIKCLEKGYSVIVSAPTGAGKTLIAERLIDKCIREGIGVIYTAPIKALSNQKFRDFSAQFPNRVGIITGDVRINPEAEVLIMTTEIFRNYLLQGVSNLRGREWVIFDEIHYLDDMERGTVWEESIIFLPPHMKLLALSATLPNIDELLGWLKEVHKNPIKKVVEEERPIPLHFYYQADNLIFSSINRLEKYMRRKGKSFYKANRIVDLVKYLKEHDLLPCIYFLFSRQGCENLAFKLSRFNFLNEKERKRAVDFYYHYTRRFRIHDQESVSRIYPLIERGIAFHHAGLLPPLKEIIERMFTSRLIKLIFTTETFALGINMPSKTVCFDEIVKFYRGKLRYLKVRDFYQMAGRAGRRGIDEEGFVFVRLKPYRNDVGAIKHIIKGYPEPIRSQFNASYATILNLYRDLKEDLISIYPLTFHHYQYGKRNSNQSKLIQAKLDLLKHMRYIREGQLTPKGTFASNIFGYELIIAELWEKGFFDKLSWIELAICICAIVTEVRPGEKLPYFNKRIKRLKREIEEILSSIHRWEKKFKIKPPTKGPHFQLAEALRAWLEGKSFQGIIQLTYADEGEIIRNFRMTIQVLRDMDQDMISSTLKQNITKAIKKLNRDIVNAEWQLKI